MDEHSFYPPHFQIEPLKRILKETNNYLYYRKLYYI